MMDEDELDPRIQVELEKLNSATDEINRLEIELDEANTTFRLLLNECTRRLKVHSSKHGNAIENARPYYEALDIARKAQQDCQQAAVNFQRANEVHEAAKETVALAESRFMSQQPEWRFDSAWQEMLNHATIKVRDAEKQRAESSAYHSQATARYKEAQEKVQMLEQRLRRNVAKSRPYFEEKQRCNEQLTAQKESVETLAAKVARVKSEYAESLRHLEAISEEIHRKRGNVQTGGCGVREPGVGAELVYKGEEEHCDSSRESNFLNADYNYDAKLNANTSSDISRDSTEVGLSTHTIDCTDEGVAEELRQVVGDFQFQTDSSDGSPHVNNDVLIKSDLHHTENPIVLRKISFESLHGLHFKPGLNEKHMGGDVGNVVPDQLTDFIPPLEGPSSFVSQGKVGFSTNQTDGEEGVFGTDNKSDISRELETDSKECSDHCDVKSCCDKLTALKVHDGNEGAKKEISDVAETPNDLDKTVGARDDIRTTAGDPKGDLTGTGDNLENDQTAFESGSKRKSVVALECSNTSFNRHPDLELSFRDNRHLQKDNDGDASLKLCQDVEVPDEQRGGLDRV